MKKITFLAVPVLWLISFFFSVPLVEPYEVSRLLALGAAVAALGVVLADPRHRLAQMSVTPLVVLVSVFLISCGLTFFWSLSPFVTIISWGTLCLLPLWFLILAVLPVTQAQTMIALRLAVAGTTILGLWALAQFFVLPQFLDVNGSIRYPFADPNNYAGLLNIGLFAALGLLSVTEKKSSKILLNAACVVMMTALVLIGSRMAMIVSVAGLCLFAGLAFQSPAFSRKTFFLVVAAGVLAFAGSGLFNDVRVTSIERAAELTAPAQDKSVEARTEIWASTFDLIGQHWMTGSGLGTYYLTYPSVRAEAEIYSSGLMAHADPLQFWAEAGLPAILLLYSILLVVLFGFFKFLKQADDKARLLGIALFCALLTLALHMHVTFHLYVASLLTLSGLILGVLARMFAGRVLLSCRVGTQAATGFILLLGFLVVFQTCLFSEMHARQAVELLNKNDMSGFGAKVNQAHQEGFGLNPRPYILAASIPLGILQTSKSSPEEREALFRQADGLLDQSIALSPINPGAYFTKALLYGAMGRGEEAIGFLEQTLKFDTHHPQARAMLGR